MKKITAKTIDGEFLFTCHRAQLKGSILFFFNQYEYVIANIMDDVLYYIGTDGQWHETDGTKVVLENL